ncbi:MAG: universal stress protein [Microbacterium sp.]|uniref:universal stress protein n=1 Tax=Microbacterium sp. TaxID=51671 RepID=UPI0039E5CF64
MDQIPETRGRSRIVVGVAPGQPAAVVTTAARFAERFDAEVVCAFVDAARYPVDEDPDGTVIAMGIDPDLADEEVETFDPVLRAEISGVLDARGLAWSVRALAGGPARELSRLAEELDAAMIVVGTRDRGFRGSFHEFFNGSVAVQLAHGQHRPVVVVPLDPVGPHETLPWDAEEER